MKEMNFPNLIGFFVTFGENCFEKDSHLGFLNRETPVERFIETNEDQMLKLREGLELLETLDRDAIRDLDLFLYVLTSDPSVLDAAKEAIAEDYSSAAEEGAEITEEDVELGEIAIAIPINSDTIYALTGSGIKLRDEYFAYSGGEGEGVRRAYLYAASYRPVVTMHSFSHMALASSDSWIDDYLEKTGGHGTVETRIKKKVQRSEDATRPVPTLEEPKTPVATPPAAPAASAVPAGTPKQTSLNMEKFVEDFLG
jgi:hypothetical protein